MKTVNRICQILAIVFGLASLVLFFTKFATITYEGGSLSAVGAQFAFGSKVSGVNLARSTNVLFCFWVTLIGAGLSALSFKSKKLRYAAPGFGIVAAVYMLVIALSKPYKFIDPRPLASVSEITYSPFVLITAIALFVFTAFAVAYLLIDDYLEVLASNGEKLTIKKRVVRFFKDYKSEIKKIVWPGIKEVIRNTVIVLIMCLIIGLLIWGVDYGLGKLLELIYGV